MERPAPPLTLRAECELRVSAEVFVRFWRQGRAGGGVASFHPVPSCWAHGFHCGFPCLVLAPARTGPGACISPPHPNGHMERKAGPRGTCGKYLTSVTASLM